MDESRPTGRQELASLRIDRGESGPSATRRWFFISAGIGLAAAAVLVAWWAWGVRPTPVRTVAVRESATGGPGAVLNATGYVTARRRATVSSKVTGKVTEIRVEEGMAVTEGQVLARLDDRSVRSYLALAEAQLAASSRALAEDEARLHLAQLTLGRTRDLVDGGISGQAQLDAAQTEVDSLVARLDLRRQETQVAEKQVAVRRTEMDDTSIRAPFSGVAISKDAQPGEMVSPVSGGGGFTRTGICTLVDMSSLEIEVDVNEAYINRVTSGQRVEAVLDAYPDWRIPASVITTIPAADRQKATVKVRIAFGGLDPRILPDMGVKVAFLEAGGDAGQAHTVRLLVPKTALRRHGDGDVVYVLRNGAAERRAVRLGTTSGEDVEIHSGLIAGESVIVEAPADLSDGDRVTVR